MVASSDLVDKPCSVCGDTVQVHPYAATKFVKCPAHKTTKAQRIRGGRPDVQNPFDHGIDLESRQRRAEGAVLTLHRECGSVAWDETVTVTALIHFDEVSGAIECFAYGGSARPGFDKVSGLAECGQYAFLNRSEVVGVR